MWGFCWRNPCCGGGAVSSSRNICAECATIGTFSVTVTGVTGSSCGSTCTHFGNVWNMTRTAIPAPPPCVWQETKTDVFSIQRQARISPASGVLEFYCKGAIVTLLCAVYTGVPNCPGSTVYTLQSALQCTLASWPATLTVTAT